MSNKMRRIPKTIRRTRKDLSDWIWHLVGRENPEDTLREILYAQRINGGKYPPSDEPVVCFTDAPLPELVAQDSVLANNNYQRLSLTGLGFRRSLVFRRGGLPVIYQPRDRFKELPLSQRWRHVDFDLANEEKPVDFTWQREWRVKGEQFKFTPEQTILLVQDTNELCDLLWEVHVDVDANSLGEVEMYAGFSKRWVFLPIEHVDDLTDEGIQVCIADDFADFAPEDGNYKVVGP